MKGGGKNTIAHYRAEAQVSRQRIGEIIDAMETRLSPARLIHDATEAAKGEIADQVEVARRTVQKYPVAVGFLGGLLGLFAAWRLSDND
ncbi:DUF3618 domain-containing protein [Pacificimonas sp. ICDLI1SI03]|jgi:DNA-binding XRE family transcriptional regulator|tara:strand:- start:60428 stop:60694 length:267 start_codon:yes stop_codon:yes gene_type:complete